MGKPKLFFLACCLGNSYSKALPRTLHLSETGRTVQTDNAGEDTASQSFVCNDQDFLIGYCTVRGNVSFRDTSKGTWYIDELTRILIEYHKRESLQHMLILVNESVTKNRYTCTNDQGEVGQFTQVPAPQHTLTKQLWF